ncbi:MAG TPA: primosomal protein N' [Solirubrobacteraceae bacterium]|nr:primosomal protein N' [Solirubrobacteraceae bacterium]
MPPVAKIEPLTTARALRGPFDYLRPDGVGVGAIVEVPFAGRTLRGVVTGLAEHSEHELAAPRRVLEQSLPPDLVELALWMAAEFCSTPARALSLVAPPAGARAKTALWAEAVPGAGGETRLSERQRELLASLGDGGGRFTGADTAALRRLEARGLVTIEPRVVRRAPEHAVVGARQAGVPELTADQRAALDAIARAHSQAPEELLLHGVTGSGKTEVYLRAVGDVLARGGGAIVLVPEIGLTPQIVSRFVERFGDTVAVLHSKLGAGERHDEWTRLRSGEARIAIGPRSAVFAPVDRLELVIVDEEHDSSYKHEGDPRYDARAVAAERARMAGAVLVAGTATPRPESFHRMPRLRMASRVDGAAMPAVEIVDMRDARRALHPRTAHALHDAAKSIVLLNRRGWSNFVSCGSCGEVWMCPECDVSLVLHRSEGIVSCHHCGHREPVPSRCDACGSVSIGRHGTGTERLEHELAGVGHQVFRLDADTPRAAAVLSAFEAAPRAVLVGTQMVAKGHDFPDVTLGVVLDADATLRFPDFRAEERTFALVAQLAGRAGRGSADGRVLVQTVATDAPSLAFAARHDSEGFLAGELARREALRYPPFSTLIRIVCSSAEPGAAAAAAEAVRVRLEVPALGPAPLFRLRGRERSQVLVKAGDRRAAIADVDAAVRAVSADKGHRAASFSVDVDPQ